MSAQGITVKSSQNVVRPPLVVWSIMELKTFRELFQGQKYTDEPHRKPRATKRARDDPMRSIFTENSRIKDV